MKKYECSYCNEVSTEGEWDKETQANFIVGITPMSVGMEGDNKYEHAYNCPKCGEYQDAYTISEK